MKRLLGLYLLIFSWACAQEPSDAAWARVAELRTRAAEAQNAGEYVEAEKYHRATLETAGEIPDFPLNERARLLSNLASALNLLGRPDEALKLLSDAEMLLQTNPSNDPGQYITLDHNIGRAHALGEDWEEAEIRYSSARDLIDAANAAETFYGAENHLGFAYVYWNTGRLEQAEASYKLAVAHFHEWLGPTHPVVQRMEAELAEVQSETRVSN